VERAHSWISYLHAQLASEIPSRLKVRYFFSAFCMESGHFSFVPPYTLCKYCIKEQPGRRLCITCGGSRFLVCTSCHGLSNLPCPDCDGNGKLRSTLLVPHDNTPVLISNPCGSCMSTGKVTCESCLGIGAMRCAGCRGLGHSKCECAVAAGYALEKL
jgi:hypothetical protein